MAEGLARVLVDTNVWISAFINAHGAPSRVLDAFLDGHFVPVTSQALLEELRTVAERPRIRSRFRLSEQDVATVIDRLRDRGIEALPPGTLRLCRDPKDDVVLETAIYGGAEFVVSRDDDVKRDLNLIAELRRRGIEVLSVAQFLDRLAARST